MSRLFQQIVITGVASGLLLLATPVTLFAQQTADEMASSAIHPDSAVLGPSTASEEIPLLSVGELEELVGPIALYPDSLLAVALPASTYPLQIVQAARFLDALEDDPALEPDANWDDSVVALINYPEAVALLNEDLDRTWRLGEAVVAQQADVLAAVENFRRRAHAAGNLKNDAHQRVTLSDEGIIEVIPVDEEIVYVPYYEPAQVVVYQTRPVYHYYPQPYPVYYYPYPSTYYFDRRFFWGVTTAFTIGWHSHRLHVFHPSYHGHPYYGHHYWDRWWYRRPSLNIYNTVYIDHHTHRSRDYRRDGDHWKKRHHRRLRGTDRYEHRREYRFDSSPSRARQSNPGRDLPRPQRSRSRPPALAEHDRDPASSRTQRPSQFPQVRLSDSRDVEPESRRSRHLSERRRGAISDSVAKKPAQRPPNRLQADRDIRLGFADTNRQFAGNRRPETRGLETNHSPRSVGNSRRTYKPPSPGPAERSNPKSDSDSRRVSREVQDGQRNVEKRKNTRPKERGGRQHR